MLTDFILFSMPNVTPAGSSPPPFSGCVEDPQQLDHPATPNYSGTLREDAPDAEQLSVCDRVEVVEVNHRPEQLNIGDDRTSGGNEQPCSEWRNREEVIKEISISSTAFIGPACRPQPVIEDELSEFYKELSQIDQPDLVDGPNDECVSESCSPSDTVACTKERGSQFHAPPDPVYGTDEHVAHSLAPAHPVKGTSVFISKFHGPPGPLYGNNQCVSQFSASSDSGYGTNGRISHSLAPPDPVYMTSGHVSQFCSPPINPPGFKETGNVHRNSYRPYPAPWPQTDCRNTQQWRPQSYDTNCSWSNPHSSQNQWRHPPPNYSFYPPPRPENPMHPLYSQSHRQHCSQSENSGVWLGPDVRPVSFHSPPSTCPPSEAFERQRYEEQRCQDLNQHEYNNSMDLVLILMRGVPGSGKSTLARQISSSGPSGLILGTDDYFYKDGYHFDPALLADAHDWNQNRAKKAMWDGHTPVIIDNTNVQAWEMKPYVMLALEAGYRVEFVEPDTSWKCDPVELEKRNHHGVPKETIVNMLDRFELPISVDIVMSSSEPLHKRKEHQSRHHRHRR